jgi:hypothetical protein
LVIVALAGGIMQTLVHAINEDSSGFGRICRGAPSRGDFANTEQ